jgi:dephospho-CoA kinase
LALSDRIVVLTGGIGCGKTQVGRLFANKGIAVVDADEIAHAITAANGLAIAPIRAAFGDEVIGSDGSLDRAKVRAKVFAHPAEREKLEAILHPMIARQAKAALAAAVGPYALYVVPLWFEKAKAQQSQNAGSVSSDRPVPIQVIAVDCTEETQIARVMQRSQLSREAVMAIMATQVSRSERREKADLVIDNDGTLEALSEQVDRIHQALIRS